MKTRKDNFKMRRRNKLVCFIISMLTIFFISCSKDDNNTSGETANTVGEANITLTAGGQEFKIIGPCGWAVAIGNNYIGANHSDNNLRTFSSYFNVSELPNTTTSYTLVENNSDTDPTHITMNISELSGSKLTSWNSKEFSGTLKLVVDGNKVTADLTGITLFPQTNSGFFTNGNVDAFANNGVLTGTLTFYKK